MKTRKERGEEEEERKRSWLMWKWRMHTVGGGWIARYSGQEWSRTFKTRLQGYLINKAT